jgi:hypothetical protein
MTIDTSKITLNYKRKALEMHVSKAFWFLEKAVKIRTPQYNCVF